MKIKGLATGIGSLPHEDAQKALDLIFKSAPNIPFWPQLPQRDIREGMIAQFSENLPCLRFKDKSLYFDSKDQEKELEKFYERIIAEDTDYFKISDNFAKGLSEFYRRLESAELNKIDFIKIQVTGPFTFGAAINDQAGKALLYDKVLMQAILKGLNMKALWQIKYFKTFGKKMILFVDEPYLGCFGSAYTPLNREDVVAGLTEFTQNLKSEDTLLGIHCCGNTDWSVIIDIKNIDIISFDAFDYQDKFVLYAKNLQGFLKRGGIIAWGIVPTQLFTGEENVELLIRKLRSGIDTLISKGVDEQAILGNLIVTPSCGLGTFTPQKAEKIFQLLSETASFIQKNF